MFSVKYLSENIKAYRHKVGLKQFELAERLGVTAQAVSKWEQKLSIPDIETLCRLANILGVSLNEMLSNEPICEKVMLAVDGGGTKTEFVLFNAQGKIKSRIVFGGSNPNVVGIEKTLEVLKTGIDGLYNIRTNILGIYCGIAGMGSGNNQELVKNFLQETYPNIRIECNTDLLNVAASITEENKCIVAICGTGSSIAAINENKIDRVGGWGYLFDGKGSGYDIGRDALTAVLAEEDGIGPKTVLTKYITKKLDGTVWDNIGQLYSCDKSFIASFTEDVFNAYNESDDVAIEIINSNFKVFANKINFAYKKYDCGNTVVISGGLIKQKDVISNIIKEELNTELNIVFPTLPQIFGACRRCCKIYGIDIDDDFSINFTDDYKQYSES